MTKTQSKTNYFMNQATALHAAAAKSSASIVRALIEAGADIEAQNSEKESPLYCAAAGNTAAVKLLLQSGAKVNILNWLNCSPLRRAAERNNRENVISLCQTGADPYLGASPLKSPDSIVSPDMKALIREYANDQTLSNV